MSLRVVDSRAFFAGMVFAGVGAVAFSLAHQYTIGSLAYMGPGFFPAAVGGVLVVVGIVSIIQGIRATVSNPLEKCKAWPVVMVLAGVVGFGLLIERAGLLVALGVLLGFSCFERLKNRPLEVLATYLLLAGFCSGLFVYVFQMPIKLVWWQ